MPWCLTPLPGQAAAQRGGDEQRGGPAGSGSRTAGEGLLQAGHHRLGDERTLKWSACPQAASGNCAGRSRDGAGVSGYFQGAVHVVGVTPVPEAVMVMRTAPSEASLVRTFTRVAVS